MPRQAPPHPHPYPLTRDSTTFVSVPFIQLTEYSLSPAVSHSLRGMDQDELPGMSVIVVSGMRVIILTGCRTWSCSEDSSRGFPFPFNTFGLTFSGNSSLPLPLREFKCPQLLAAWITSPSTFMISGRSSAALHFDLRFMQASQGLILWSLVKTTTQG